jgi:heat shock protein HslJ
VVPAVPAATASLAFAPAGQLSGTTGCNSFTGSYAAQGSTLKMTLGAMTTKACTDPAVVAQETALTSLLPTVRAYSLAVTELRLTGGDGATVLVYTAGAAGLEGSSWRITGVNNGRGAVETTTLTESLTAGFGPGGSFQAFGGCNQLSGTYALSGKTGITIGPLTSTHKTCTADINELEAAYVTALGKVATFQLSGTTLTLRDQGGAAQVTAAAA